MDEAREFEGGETASDDDFELDDDEPLAAANERAKKNKKNKKNKGAKKPAQKRAGSKGASSKTKRSKKK